MNRTPLQQAAFCALADLTYIWEEEPDIMIQPMKETWIELYDALTSEGFDMSGYANVHQGIRESLDEE